MPLSNAERQRRFRAKKRRLGQYEEFKAKHREEVKTNREKKKNKEKLLPKKEQLALQRKRRQDTKKRVAACRQRKKQQNQNALILRSADTMLSTSPENTTLDV